MCPTSPTIEYIRLHEHDDDNFISAIKKLAAQDDNSVFQRLFQELAGLTLDPKTADSYWKGVVQHRSVISKALGRPFSLASSLNDYLATCTEEQIDFQLIDKSFISRILQDSFKDKLTGLNNRAYFDEIFEQQLSFAKRYNTDLTLLFFDVDNFKDVNDQFGHQAGDLTLQHISTIVGEAKRDSDIAVRYGGEEFILLMPHTGKINGMLLAERIREAVAQKTISYRDHSFSVTLSGGISSHPVDGESTTAILETADRALYQAKGAGKNVIRTFREDKRRYLRVQFGEPVYVKELEMDANESHEGASKDICIGGILFTNDRPLRPGTKIQIHTKGQKHNPLLLIGKVVRVESLTSGEYDIGVSLSFNELEKVAKEEIAELLRSAK